MCRSCSIYCIVPPVVFEQIAKNGNKEQREWAIDTVSRDHSLRAARLHNSLVTGAGPIRADALATTDPGKPKRTVYDAKNLEQVTGEVVRAEGGPAVGDEAADEAFDGLGATYALWYEVYKRDSIDDAGLPLDAVVHYGDRYDNAFWDGQRMVFGDGDGELFNRFTVALDVIGHELASRRRRDDVRPQLLAAAGRAQRERAPTCSARSSSSTRRGRAQSRRTG